MSTPAGPVRYLAVRLHQEGQTRGVFVVANFLSQVVTLSVLVAASALAWVVAASRMPSPLSGNFSTTPATSCAPSSPSSVATSTHWRRPGGAR